MPFVPLPLPVPHKQAEHGHNDEKQEDNSHDGACRLPLGAPRWANLGVGVQLLHHQSCYRESSDVQTRVFGTAAAQHRNRRRRLLTLIAADAFISGAAVAGPGHIVAGSIVEALAQLLAAVAECASGTLCMRRELLYDIQQN